MSRVAFLLECQNYFENAIAKGARVHEFPCPLCDKALMTFAPPDGDVWDSLSTCWHCGSTYWKEAYANRVVTKIPPKKSP